MPFAIEPSTEISHRTDFSLICNARGYVDAVEVGVDLGVFARQFLDRWDGNWLLCVDPYAPYGERPYDRSLDAAIAVQALAPYHGRVRFIRQPSPDAVLSVQRLIRAPQFIYLDACHDFEPVRRDLAAWWDALAPGGLLAGHDFDDDHPGVVKAVTAFARDRGLVVRLTHEETSPKSWYVYRGEPATYELQMFIGGTRENPHYVAPA